MTYILPFEVLSIDSVGSLWLADHITFGGSLQMQEENIQIIGFMAEQGRKLRKGVTWTIIPQNI